MKSKVLTFFSLKGGEGKTTSCANISISLGIIKKNILIIDLDPIGNLTSSFVLENIIDYDSSKLFEKSINLKTDIIKSLTSNVDLIPANSFNLSYILFDENKEAINNFHNNINKLKTKYEYILIDTSACINKMNEIILKNSNSLIIPMTCEQFSLNTIPNMFSLVRKIQSQGNNDLRIEGVIITKFNKNTTSSLYVLTEIIKIFDGYVYENLIPADSSIPKYYLQNKNIILGAPWKPSAISYTKLTKEILNKEKS